jgi:hypothetical protein
MSNWQSALGIMAGVITFLSLIPYIITTLQGKTRPNRATWWIWVTLSIILTASQYSAGAMNTLWITGCAIVGQLFIAVLSLKRGDGGWNRFDRLCIAGSILSLLLWWQSSSALVAIVFNIVIDWLGALPTVVKSYRDPESENLTTWSLYLLASTLNLFAVEQWSLAIGLLPMYLFVVNVIIVTFLLRSRVRSRLRLPFLHKKSHRVKPPLP